MKMILGKKVGMISSFTKDGKMLPITVIHSEPNFVLENKTKEKDGYIATKVGFLSCSEKNITKSQMGILKKAKCLPKKHIKEFKNVDGYQIGDLIKVDTFKIGDHIDAQGISKGHGFTGAIKRWNFKCGPKSHGAGYPHRYQGSISFGRGGSQGQRVMKGKKMSGHYGQELVTIHNLVIVNIDLEKNLLLIRGSMPGPKNGLVLIKTTNKVKNLKKISDLVNNKIQNESLSIEV